MEIRTVEKIEDIREVVSDWRRRDLQVALVPTMGFLHEGHLDLVRRAGQIADRTLVSVFVNPTQFGPGEDFEAYPRDLDGDSQKVASVAPGAVVFAPLAAEMYPVGEQLTWVETAELGRYLCGASRPNHFRGVQTVVLKLLQICTPDHIVFGLKDAQQYLIISRMLDDLNIACAIHGVETRRERDGLAMSSRNKYLSGLEREEAGLLFQAVSRAREMISLGETSAKRVEEAMHHILAQATNGRIDYASVVSRSTLQPIESIVQGDAVVAAVAVYFGRARLIDNAIISLDDV